MSYSSSSKKSSKISSEDDDNSDYEFDDNDKDTKGMCIRNRSNFSHVKSFHLFDKQEFDSDLLNIYIESGASPKLKLLLDNIKKLDEEDLKNSGKLHKHLIFTDVNRSAYGIKIIASALIANGINIAFEPRGTGFHVYPNEKLEETKNNNFALLISKTIFDRPMNIKVRKNILDVFNSRPDNINGDLIRFIILDQGFKEGIDLFDVKYVHLFEPFIIKADQKQAIGRATRFCGQKRLQFHPTYGWPLYVFTYDVSIPKSITNFNDYKTLFDLYLDYSGIDLRKVIFASEIEKLCIDAAVDYELTKNIHSFSIAKPDFILKGGAVNTPPIKFLKKSDMQKYILNNFSEFKYDEIDFKNNCETIKGGASEIVSFTPTQNFIRHYFTPASPYKGMLLHHSVGTGKTCTAIATASTSFQNNCYNILWVTRHTLKSDIWKNMFKQVCNVDLQNKMIQGLKLPSKVTGKSKYIGDKWMEPISYKQFSNMLLKKNKIYHEMVKKNGDIDILKRTLLIIDEAHKLYSPNIPKSEKPDTDILEKLIHNSYAVSGNDSVRILLMTATPITEDGMEIIKLLNLLRENDKVFPNNFNDFSKEYLDDKGFFKRPVAFQDEISGYISYLNRGQDARNFAIPLIQNVYTEMSSDNNTKEKLIGKTDLEIKKIRESNKILRDEIKGNKGNIQKNKEELKNCISDAKEINKQSVNKVKNIKKSDEDKCKTLPKNERKDCKEKAINKYKEKIEELKKLLEIEIEKCNKNVGDLDKVKELNDLIRKNREEIKVLTENKKNIKNEITKIKDKVKENKIILASKKSELKVIEGQYKSAIKQLNDIKSVEEKKLKLRELQKSDTNKEIKNLKNEIKKLKGTSVNNKNKLDLLLMKEGKKKLKNVSQEYALKKFCKI